MSKIISLLICILIPSGLLAQNPSGTEVLKKIDQNLSSKSRIVESKMIIHGRRGNRTISSKSWTEGETKSFTEYLAPAREKGTKMLKLEDQLWMYSPSSDRIIKISGHMLRQSVMGSDLSYEDMMDDSKLEKDYDADISTSETIGDRDCWVVELVAKNKDVAYHMRKIWVDKKRYIPLKSELYAKSGKLLKRIEMSMVEKIDGRWFPRKMHFFDMLKRGDGTEFIVDKISFNESIPDYIFSKAALKK